MGAGCIVHCNKVSKPVKGKCLLLCMHSIMYFLITSYTLIIKVLSRFIMKIKNFMKYFKEGSRKITKFACLIFFNRASLVQSDIIEVLKILKGFEDVS